MRQDTERRILDALRAYVHDVIVDALSDSTPARARKAPATRPTSTTLHLSPQQARIVAAVRSGYRTPPELAREIQTSLLSARVQISRLVRAGVLRRVERGVYEVA